MIEFEEAANQRGIKTYASDCTCADAPWEAIKQLHEAIKQLHEPGFSGQTPWVRVFGSEDSGPGGDAPRAFMSANGPPKILFDSMLDRGDVAYDRWSGQEVRVPSCLIYSAGFVCKDLSSANTLNPRMLTPWLDESSGLSTRTLHASLAYIEEPTLEERAFSTEFLRRVADEVMPLISR